jgi:hypothetical protein
MLEDHDGLPQSTITDWRVTGVKGSSRCNQEVTDQEAYTSCAWVAPSRTVVGTVTLTERTGGKDPHYRVAIGGEMFFNKDALEIGKSNSGTLQAQLSSHTSLPIR